MNKLFSANHLFRRYLIFQSLSNIGSGLFGFFMIWVVHYQYQNPLFTGIAGMMWAVSGIGSFLVGPFVDKRNKIKIIRIITFVQLCVVAILLATMYVGNPGVWVLLVSILAYDIALTFGSPAKTAFLPTIVAGDDLIKANALLNMIAITGSLLIGFFIFMNMDGSIGVELAYGIAVAVLFLATVASFFLKKGEEPQDVETAKNYFAELKIGLKFTARGPILHILLVFLAMSVFANIAAVNLPMLAEAHSSRVSGGMAYMALAGIASVGGIIGSYISKHVGEKYKLSGIFIVGIIITGVVRIIFVQVIPDNFVRSLWIMALYAGLGSAVGICYGTFMQKITPQHIMARVTTVRFALYALTATVGAFLGGIMGTALPDVDTIFVIQGVSYIVIGACILLSKHLRKLPKVNEVETLELG